MDIIKITYRFQLEADKQEQFELKLDARSLELIDEDDAPVAAWAALENHQCPNCPYQKELHPNCMVAKHFAVALSRFSDICSYDEIELEVITDERRVIQKTTAQRAISSFLGLIFATSGCAHTAYMKPMARFHLPLASQEETAFRAAGMYLLAQYFREKSGLGGELSMDGLKKIYQDLHVVNVAITSRLRSALTAEASINALVILDTRANLMPFAIEEHFDDFRHLFDVYLSDETDDSESDVGDLAKKIAGQLSSK